MLNVGLGVWRPRRGPYVVANTEAATLIAAFSTAPTEARKFLIDRLVGALKAGGVWAQLDLLYVLAAADSQAAGLNWITPASFALSVGGGAPTFTADRGFTYNGTSDYHTTAWDPATNGTKIAQNTAHIGVYMIATGSAAQGDFGSGTSNYLGARGRQGTGAIVRADTATQLVGLAGGPVNGVHILGARQNDSANQRLYRNGSFEVTGAQASSSLTTDDLNFGRVNSAFTNRQLGAGGVGGTLTDQQIAAKYAALHTYMVAVGADV